MLPDTCTHNVHDDMIRCKTPPPNLNFANIYLRSVWSQTTKLKDRQYFQLCGIY